MTGELSNRVVAVTGASSGIGEAVARSCAQAGAAVDAVRCAISQPPNVSVNEVLVRPSGQVG